MRSIAVAMLAVVACACSGAPPSTVEPAAAPSEDIDVLGERIDCRRSVDGKVEIDPRCCKDNFQAAGC